MGRSAEQHLAIWQWCVGVGNRNGYSMIWFKKPGTVVNPKIMVIYGCLSPNRIQQTENRSRWAGTEIKPPNSYALRTFEASTWRLIDKFSLTPLWRIYRHADWHTYLFTKRDVWYVDALPYFYAHCGKYWQTFILTGTWAQVLLQLFTGMCSDTNAHTLAEIMCGEVLTDIDLYWPIKCHLDKHADMYTDSHVK